MSSIQERLQLKRVPLDTWNIKEQLCLASAVVRSGDQNWMSVSRALKTVGESNKPADWYSQKSCAAQYGVLLEHVETPKRKKRNSEGAVETPQESILKKLTQERMVEIQKNLAEMNQQYEQIVNEINELRNPATNDDRVREMWTGIETAKRVREREAARRAAWLREREERRARAERAWRPPQASPTPTTTPSPSAAPPSSPLLTSLLKSSPVVTTPQHISHPANVVDTMSPSVNAPTLSSLLERAGGVAAVSAGVGTIGSAVGTIGTGGGTIGTAVGTIGAGVGTMGTGVGTIGPGVGTIGSGVGTIGSGVGTIGSGVGAVAGAQSASAAIEHIKSQLVQIEQQLKANTSPAPTVDIDDIEIKAEDVYAFSDIDIVIPPVATLHKPSNRATEKQYKKEEAAPTPEEVIDNVTQDVKEEIEEEHTEEIRKEDVEEIQTKEKVAEEVTRIPEPSKLIAETEAEVKISFPEVKFPTMEIKVITSDEKKVKEEIKEPKTPQVEAETVANIENVIQEIVEDTPESTPVAEEESEIPQVMEAEVKKPDVDQELELAQELVPNPENIPLPPDSPVKVEERIEEVPLPPLPEAYTPLQQEQAEQIAKTEELPLSTSEGVEKILQTEDDIKKEEDAEDSLPLKEIMAKETAPEADAETDVKLEIIAETEEVHTETDDDTPMELSREEEKDGKKRRDYSRKKKPDSRTCSGSESAPESPGGCDPERQHRLWKRSVMLVYSRLCAHKYASVFLRPISDEEAPGYSAVVRRPMDLSLIKRNIESGGIRTTAEFQRDVLLMLSNALLYNSSEHSVYQMARDMHEEAVCQLGMLLCAQAHAGLAAPAATRKRRRQHAPHNTKRQHL